MYSDNPINYNRTPETPGLQYGINPNVSNPQMQYATPTNQPTWMQQMPSPGMMPFGTPALNPSMGGSIMPITVSPITNMPATSMPAQGGMQFPYSTMPSGMQSPAGMTIPGGMQSPAGMQIPSGMATPGGLQMPSGVPMPGGITTPGATPTEMNPMLEVPVMETDYTQGYLKTQIGRRVKIDFLIGTNTVQDRDGILVDVGISYVIINETDTDDLLLCDIYSIKFVRFYY